ncbi:hypothetical protein L6452_09401 [Arctium lappa]|uniref:Uncharacterized protein n=1 Tax=Arctium lappa TaxID=4217 RepID=A0ACB9DJZ1_ARCLA|nr:hypothetical protein L6452_09401 [Arctium lappa]
MTKWDKSNYILVVIALASSNHRFCFSFIIIIIILSSPIHAFCLYIDRWLKTVFRNVGQQQLKVDVYCWCFCSCTIALCIHPWFNPQIS